MEEFKRKKIVDSFEGEAFEEREMEAFIKFRRELFGNSDCLHDIWFNNWSSNGLNGYECLECGCRCWDKQSFEKTHHVIKDAKKSINYYRNKYYQLLAYNPTLDALENILDEVEETKLVLKK